MKNTLLALALLVASSTAFAGWQSDIATNQNMAMNYISSLRLNPSAKRPQLISNPGWQSQRSMGEINSAMDRAEELARAGRPDLIEIPQFKYGAEKDMMDKRRY